MDFGKLINLRVLPSCVTNSKESFLHLPYKEEVKLFGCIKEGNAAALYEKIKLLEYIPVGRLSENEIRQYRYIAICFITLAVRYAVEGGMNESEAYAFSDSFIGKIDSIRSGEEIVRQIAVSAIKLTNSVCESRKNARYSPYVRKCIHYVNDNLGSKITVGQLAAVCNLSGDYLSSVFKREYGCNLSDFILSEKLSAARTMLADGMKQEEICSCLAFSSQSYFISAFKREYGITPGKFRKEAQ